MTTDSVYTPLERGFFDRPVLEVATDLLGRTLVRYTPDGTVRVRLTEVEAYDGERDPGSHAFRGRTQRNGSMFGPPGHAYVYFTYGMWHCLNTVCGPDGYASGVLLRAGEIIAGADLVRHRRPSARRDSELAKGPARLATALDIDRALDGTDLCATTEGRPAALRLEAGTPAAPEQILRGPRTGVGGEGGAHPWRFWIGNDPSVSPYRAHRPRERKSAARAA